MGYLLECKICGAKHRCCESIDLHKANKKLFVRYCIGIKVFDFNAKKRSNNAYKKYKLGIQTIPKNSKRYLHKPVKMTVAK